MGLVAELSESTLPFAAGYLAGCMDLRLGSGRRDWTMKVYMDMAAGKLSVKYLHDLELEIGLAWPAGERRPSLRDLFGGIA